MAARPALAALILTLAAPAGALAQSPAPGVFTPPPGCQGFLTVQSRGCRVSNHYRCEADAPGDQWRADFDQEGPYFVSRIDAEGQWVESYDLFPTVRQVLDAGPEDAQSFSTLLAEGIDTFAFGLSRDTGETSRVRGFDRLTGAEVVIDGIPLRQTDFEFTETNPDGSLRRRARGREYIHPDWRLFFAGPSEWDGGDGFVAYDGSPVQFVFAGEPGFMATEPLYECDAILSRLPLSPLPKEDTSHDDL
ncbi:MAG: hypothetical protein IE927_00735 [Rhodobacterales bacterium]|nr:hypothetical protein [Rhodobacterales bacterium]